GDGEDLAAQWIDCKYTSEADDSGLRFRNLLQSIIRRVGDLSPVDSTLDEAWAIFRNSKDPELDHLEAAFFELARLFSDLMQVDGARHRSVSRLCWVWPNGIGVVISQDGQVRLIANVDDSVVFWADTMI